jgi:hypothetical protein
VLQFLSNDPFIDSDTKLILSNLQALPLFRPPLAIRDQCPDLWATALGDWYGNFAGSGQMLAAQHPFAVADHTITPSLRHAFNYRGLAVPQ